MKYIRFVEGVERKIAKMLSKPMSLREISYKAGISKPLASYHIKKLMKKGIVQVAYHDMVGNMVSKYYVRSDNVFIDQFTELKEQKSLGKTVTVVIGSPSPHGESMSFSKDLIAAVKIGQIFPHAKVIYDTMFGHHIAYGDVVIVGGPLVNSAYKRFSFPKFSGRSFRIRRKYSSPFHGLISSRNNHYGSNVIAVAGNSSQGTLAAVIALSSEKVFNFITRNYADVVVKGTDKDGDGIIDSFGVVYENKRRSG